MALFKVTNNFLEFIRSKAHDYRENAAHGGRMDDGGARELESQIDAYCAGMKGSVPINWESYVTEYERISDPEYKNYLRLKQKFGV